MLEALSQYPMQASTFLRAEQHLRSSSEQEGMREVDDVAAVDLEKSRPRPASCETGEALDAVGAAPGDGGCVRGLAKRRRHQDALLSGGHAAKTSQIDECLK